MEALRDTESKLRSSAPEFNSRMSWTSQISRRSSVLSGVIAKRASSIFLPDEYTARAELPDGIRFTEKVRRVSFFFCERYLAKGVFFRNIFRV